VPGIARTVLREQVKDLLVQRILRGELQPGERLVETRIAQELGTSQAPVREALRDLELLRLVESEPFRSARVRQLGEGELLEIYPVRASLEELAARLAFAQLGGDVDRFEVEVDGMRAAARRGDLWAFVSHDIAFHREVVVAAANAPLLRCWQTLGLEAPLTLAIYGTEVTAPEAAELHVPIVESLRRGPAATAGRQARRHVEHFARLARRARARR
jgi:DNA-binding GntR family transcriptional regulator